MTDERRKHQCHREGCDSEAVYATKLLFDVAAPGVRYPIRTMCSIQVCERHKSEKDVRGYLLSPQNREQITTAIMEGGHPEPDFLTAKVLFEPLERRALMIHAMPPPSCDRDGCTKAARWQIKQLFRMLWQRGKGKPEVQVLTNFCVCDEHKASARPADLLDPDSKSATLAWLNARGVSMPDFKTMELGFVPLHGGKRMDPRTFLGDDGPRDQFKAAAK
jgi:hypothetical protein